MATNLRVGDQFPAIELPTTNSSLHDYHTSHGFTNAYPLIVVFFIRRGTDARSPLIFPPSPCNESYAGETVLHVSISPS